MHTASADTDTETETETANIDRPVGPCSASCIASQLGNRGQILISGSPASGHELIQRLKQQVGRLCFTADELIGRTSRSGALKIMFLAFRQDSARDWASQLEISPKHHGKADSIEYDHIFPRSFLKKNRPDLKDAEVNDIANLGSISAATNKRISDHSPAEYRQDIASSDLATQQIDLDNVSGADGFEPFIAARRQAVVVRLNRFLGVAGRE